MAQQDVTHPDDPTGGIGQVPFIQTRAELDARLLKTEPGNHAGHQGRGEDSPRPRGSGG